MSSPVALVPARPRAPPALVLPTGRARADRLESRSPSLIRLLVRLIFLAVLAVLALGLYQRLEPSVAHVVRQANLPAKIQTARRDLGH